MEVLCGGSYGKMSSIRPTLGKTSYGGECGMEGGKVNARLMLGVFDGGGALVAGGCSI